MNPYYNDHSWIGIFPPLAAAAIGIVVAIIAVWSLIWKGLALWKAARLGHRGWFIALLIINTAGILDILYIYYFSKRYHPRVPGPDEGHHHHHHDHGHDHHHHEPHVAPGNPPQDYHIGGADETPKP